MTTYTLIKDFMNNNGLEGFECGTLSTPINLHLFAKKFNLDIDSNKTPNEYGTYDYTLENDEVELQVEVKNHETITQILDLEEK